MPHPYGNVDGYTILKSMKGVFIKQKPQYLEAMTGCDFENKYYIYQNDEEGD